MKANSWRAMCGGKEVKLIKCLIELSCEGTRSLFELADKRAPHSEEELLVTQPSGCTAPCRQPETRAGVHVCDLLIIICL